MKKDIKKIKKAIKQISLIVAIISSPTVIAAVFIFGMTTVFMTVFADTEDESELNAFCEPNGEYNESAIKETFAIYHNLYGVPVYPLGEILSDQHTTFYKYAEKYKVDAVLAMAIVLEETDWGKSERFESTLNVAPTFLGKKTKFKSVDSSIKELFKKLKENTVKEGKFAILELPDIYTDSEHDNRFYTPEQRKNIWKNNVSHKILNLGGVANCTMFERNLATVIVEGEYVLPTFDNFRVTSGFGYRIHPITDEISFHTGIDLACSKESPILAYAEGTVTYVEDKPNRWSTTLGNYIIIQHGNGVSTYYGHLHPSTTLVKIGDRVVGGQQIAGCGTSGGSTGYHLDFKMRLKSEYIDPYPYLTNATMVSPNLNIDFNDF